ncbi:MAG: metal-sensitive transcriptional regulator [Leptospiraceae bacterium]|nr:metal-sensitive transcriptional regulator [Leptospiraceae bacterium]MDW7975072.1 metal-sensitive transcriptional regulator [Leptospiraceae bacterium]
MSTIREKRQKKLVNQEEIKEKEKEIEDFEQDSDQMNLIKRMNRIIGQVQGVKKMIENERACVDILSQITAIKSALDGVAMAVLEKEAEQCFQNVVEKNPQSKEQALKDFISLIRKYGK